MPDDFDLTLNVVTEANLRDLVANGWRLEIVCNTSAFKKGPSWYGVWVMRAVSDSGMEKHLVTARTRTTQGDIKIREFKTITGVVSFLVGLEFDHANLPLKEGQRTVYTE